MPKKKTSKHGGDRPGVGRPAPQGRRRPVCVSLSPDVHAFLDQYAVFPFSRSSILDAAIRSTEAFKEFQK